MCGIVGIYSPGKICDTDLVGAMLKRISHRGPDASGVWHDSSIAVGQCRLAIRDLSASANQPFLSSDKRFVTVFNGEIYNDSYLAKSLKRERGFVKRTNTDTEIIAEAYACWGIDAFSMFEGMFAIALWDRVKEDLIMARDGIGIKPLYIDDMNSFMFASEIKALLVTRNRRYQISPQDLDHMLATGYVSPSSTLIGGIRQLQPGTVVIINREGYTEHRFWYPKRNIVKMSFEDAVMNFTAIFSETVKSQLVSDVPLGIMQSGGIDSSLVTLSLPPGMSIPLFSVRFPGLDHDESYLVKELSSAYNKKVVWIDLPTGTDIEYDFRAVVDGLDGQIADSSALATYVLSRAIHTHAKVVLSGDGGDEFFGGYTTYPVSIFSRYLSGLLPRSFLHRASRIIREASGISLNRISTPEKISRLFEGMAHPVPHAVWRYYLASQDRASLYGPALQELLYQDPFQGYAAVYSQYAGQTLDKALLSDQTYYLPADMLVKVDRMSMAHGLEVRVPFLDRKVMEFANSLSGVYLIGKGFRPKRILRTALARLKCPKKILHARKSGFNIPMNSLLQRELNKLVVFYLIEHPEIYAPFLIPDVVRKIALDHLAGKIDSKYIIWTLLTIGVWREKEGI
jgi:asparagine synthase (glutamine-hydrolysing)